MARAWQREPAVFVRLSSFVQATITKRGVYLLRDRSNVLYLDDREAERFAEEWARFNGKRIAAGAEDAGDDLSAEAPETS